MILEERPAGHGDSERREQLRAYAVCCREVQRSLAMARDFWRVGPTDRVMAPFMRKIVFGSCFLIGLSLSSCGVDSPPDLPVQGGGSSTGSSGSVQVPTSNGIRLSLDGRFRTALVGRRNADGSITADCYDDMESVAALVQATARATTAPAPTATRAEVR